MVDALIQALRDAVEAGAADKQAKIDALTDKDELIAEQQTQIQTLTEQLGKSEDKNTALRLAISTFLAAHAPLVTALEAALA